jgi:hypothetical protein
MKMANKLGVEFIRTFWLVLGGCGSAVLAAGFPDVTSILPFRMDCGPAAGSPHRS